MTRHTGLLLTILLLLTGCSHSLLGPALSGDAARTDLLTRPDIDTASGELQTMLTEITDTFGTELGLTGWTTDDDDDGSETGCVDLVDIGGKMRETPALRRAGGIPDHLWLPARDIVTTIAARYGFGPTRTFADEPGRHEFYGFGRYDAFYRIGTEVNAYIRASTGCHPTAADIASQPPR